eukprot:5556643-Ditylum_brightwellii.AAC.1
MDHSSMCSLTIKCQQRSRDPIAPPKVFFDAYFAQYSASLFLDPGYTGVNAMGTPTEDMATYIELTTHAKL